MLNTIKRESPVHMFTGAVISKSQSDATAKIRITGGRIVTCIMSAHLEKVESGSTVVVARFDGVDKPIVISAAKIGAASASVPTNATGVVAIEPSAPGEIVLTEGAYSLLVRWNSSFPWDMAYVVSQADDDGTGNPDISTEQPVLVTSGTYYIYYGVPGVRKHIRIRTLRVVNDAVSESSFSEWHTGVTQEPFDIQVDSEPSISVSGGVLAFDDQNPHVVLAGPASGIVVDTPSFRPLNFPELGDTPDSYAGQAGLYVKVNATANGLVFGAGGSGGGSDTSSFTMRWVADGALAICSEFDGVWVATGNVSIATAWLYCYTTGTAGNTTVDIEYSTDGVAWTSLLATKLVLAFNDANKLVTVTPSVLSFSSGTMFRACIDGVATGARGASVGMSGSIGFGSIITRMPSMGAASRR
jgi:hypothetical protein